MWIFAKDGFLSIVQHSQHKSLLLVRSRFRGDIEELFQGAEVEETLDADYRYRAMLPKWSVAESIGRLVGSIDYPNFKGSLADQDRHDVYLRVWETMLDAQRLNHHREANPDQHGLDFWGDSAGEEEEPPLFGEEEDV